MTTNLGWRKARRCESCTCVEVAVDGDAILMRDSKNPDVVLRFTRAEWDAFVGGAKDGDFDNLSMAV